MEERLSVVLVGGGPGVQQRPHPTANGGALIAGHAVDPSVLFQEMVYAGRFLNDQDVV